MLYNFFNGINNLFIEHTGVTSNVLSRLSSSNTDPILFKPYESKSNFLYRGFCIISAPFSFWIMAFEMALATCYQFIKLMCYDIFTGNTPLMQEDAWLGVRYGMSAPVFFLCGFLSPFINGLDFLGALYTSCTNPIVDDEDEDLDDEETVIFTM